MFKFVDRLLPGSLRSGEVEALRRARLVALGVLIANLASVGAIVLAYAIGHPEVVPTLLLTLVAHSAVLVVLWLTRSPAAAAHFLAAVVMFEVMWDHGPDNGFAAMALIALPIGVTVLAGTRAGMAWTLIGMAYAGYVGPYVIRPDVLSPDFGLGVALMILVLGCCALVVELTRVAAVRETELARRRLAEHEDRMVHFAEAAFPGIVVTHRAAVTYASPGVAGLVGYSPEELCSMDLREIIDPEAMQGAKAVAADVVAGTTGHFRGELRLRTREGPWVWVEAYGFRNVEEVSGQRWIFGARDVSDEIAAREQLERAQRLESVGTLAAGVSHDFNNLLTVINGFADLMPEGGDKQGIQSAVDQASQLTRQLMAFARPESGDAQSSDLVATVRRMQAMVDSLAGEQIDAEVSAPAAALSVPLDATRLGQVLLNLVANARDAMPGGGQLSVDVQAATLDRASASSLGVQPGAYAVLSVRDNGLGMSDEVRRRAFDPFYTTKAQGSGLGLSSTYRIALGIGGTVDLRSAPGVGSDVSVYLPLVEADTAIESNGPKADEPEVGSRRVLFVEDYDLLRQMCTAMLERHGCEVQACPDADAALALFDASAPPDLVISDVVMPGLRGTALVDALRQQSPTLPALLISGYADEDLQEWASERAGVDVLMKPFSYAELTTKVDRLIASREQASRL